MFYGKQHSMKMKLFLYFKFQRKTKINVKLFLNILFKKLIFDNRKKLKLFHSNIFSPLALVLAIYNLYREVT